VTSLKHYDGDSVQRGGTLFPAGALHGLIKTFLPFGIFQVNLDP